MNTPSGPMGHPITGNAKAFQSNPLTFLEECAAYGDLSHFRIGTVDAYLVNHPDLIHEVLVAQPEKFHKNRILKRSTKAFIGDGLLTSEGEFHRRQRRMIQPAFHHRRIASYGEIMTRHTQAMLGTWEHESTLDVTQQMTRLTLGIVAEALFGADVSADAAEIGRAISLGIERVGGQLRGPVIRLPDWFPTPENRERREAAAFIRHTVMGMIAARRRAGDAAERDDLLSMLLTAVDEEDADAAMTADQVYDEAITLFIAGHETTAIALSWSLYLLSQHPEAEAALLAEVGSVLGDRTPTVVDVPALKFTEWVAKEAMRLYPPAWVMGRITIEDVTLGGARIGKGSGVLMSPWVTHHDPRWYSDPLAFHPDRWGPDESGVELDKRIPRYAYFPFGGGPRVCIGQPFAMMELSLVLPQIVRAARLDLLPDQRIEPWPLVTLRPRHGIQMQVSRRETPAHRASRLPAQEIAV